MKTQINLKQTAQVIGLLLAGLFLGWLFFGSSSGDKSTAVSEHIEESHTDEQGNIVYTCSMHPQIRRNEPGNCPICGMELIPLDEARQENDATFTMTPSAVKLAAIQTSPVERRVPEVEVRLPGRLATDERRVASITARFSGRIEELFVDFRGTYVREGEKLATIYSPDLISAQRELIEAAKNKSTDPGLYHSVRRKLRLWDLPESEVQRIEEKGEVTDALPVVATRSGFVIQKNVDAKDYVNEGTVMYKLADLSRLWVIFDAYETDLGAVKTGHSVDFTVPGYPGKVFESTVTYIDPFIDPQSRTARIRAEVSNSEGLLKPDMLARGIIHGSDGESEKLMIPRSAVLWTGKRSIVFVEHTRSETPTFEPRLITLGKRAGDYYIVEAGLEEGEQVVTNGTFKLDSAAQLADKLSMMNRSPGTGTNRSGEHDHGEINIAPSGIQEPKGDHSSHSDRSVKMESGHSDVVPEEFRQQLQQTVQAYMKLKDALVKSGEESASGEARLFMDQLKNMDRSLLRDEAHDTFIESLNKMTVQAEIIVGETDINEQRRAFYLLSEALAKSINTFGIRDVVYYQYCPMAFDGKGAHWLSEDENVVNPYLGESMINCGEVIEEINF